MIERQPFDISAGPALVLPKIEQPADAFDRKAELARPFDEPQREHVRLRVHAIAAGAAVRDGINLQLLAGAILANDCSRHILPVPVGPGERPFTGPTTADRCR